MVCAHPPKIESASFCGDHHVLDLWLARVQPLTSNKPYPSGVGGSGMALASDGSVALLSGSPATATAPANAFLFSFYASANQYNTCPQQITVRPLASPSAAPRMLF